MVHDRSLVILTPTNLMFSNISSSVQLMLIGAYIPPGFFKDILHLFLPHVLLLNPVSLVHFLGCPSGLRIAPTEVADLLLTVTTCVRMWTVWEWVHFIIYIWPLRVSKKWTLKFSMPCLFTILSYLSVTLTNRKWLHFLRGSEKISLSSTTTGN